MKQWKYLLIPIGLMLFSLPFISPAHGELHLSALPERTAAVLTLAQAAPVVSEERLVSLQTGENKLHFSWQGIPVLDNTIRLDFPDKEDALEIISVSRQAGGSSLSWHVYSAAPAQAKVRISYGLRQIDGFFALRVIAGEDETSCRIERYMILRNFSGEDFESLSVVTPSVTIKPRPVRNGETIRSLAGVDDMVKIEKIWRYDSRKKHLQDTAGKQGSAIPVYYRIANTAAGGLGESPIPGGKVRVFHRNEKGKTLLLGEDKIETVRPGNTQDIYIGESRDISVITNVMKEKRINVRRNENNRVILYDTEESVRFAVENFKDSAASLNLLYHVQGQWQLSDSPLPWRRKSAHIAELDLRLEPKSRKELMLEYRRCNIRP